METICDDTVGGIGVSEVEVEENNGAEDQNSQEPTKIERTKPLSIYPNSKRSERYFACGILKNYYFC